jgi:hypothetical protein
MSMKKTRTYSIHLESIDDDADKSPSSSNNGSHKKQKTGSSGTATRSKYCTIMLRKPLDHDADASSLVNDVITAVTTRRVTKAMPMELKTCTYFTVALRNSDGQLTDRLCIMVSALKDAVFESRWKNVFHLLAGIDMDDIYVKLDGNAHNNAAVFYAKFFSAMLDLHTADEKLDSANEIMRQMEDHRVEFTVNSLNLHFCNFRFCVWCLNSHYKHTQCRQTASRLELLAVELLAVELLAVELLWEVPVYLFWRPSSSSQHKLPPPPPPPKHLPRPLAQAGPGWPLLSLLEEEGVLLLRLQARRLHCRVWMRIRLDPLVRLRKRSWRRWRRQLRMKLPLP